MLREASVRMLMSIFLFFYGPVFAGAANGAGVWPRPEIIPPPAHTHGASKPVISLNGPWKFTLAPPKEFWANSADPSSWREVKVPGELVMQGVNLFNNTEFPYKKAVLIPPDFKGKHIILRFDGVYSYARVWVNGKYVRDHEGGFTSWDCDITDYVVPGETAWVTVGITDKIDDVSYGSLYVFHNIGGILRDVSLLAVPANYLTRLYTETDLTPPYTDARLKVTAGVAFHGAARATVKLRLKDAQNTAMVLSPASLTLTPEQPEAVVEIPVKAPKKWDAEHPNLYTFEATVVVDGMETETVERKIGFRKIEIDGNKMLVNGQVVKLRGILRHSVHPLLGRSLPPELDEQDAKMIRDANINLVRTSHYPPTEKFLEACDRYGIYVEEETAVCFVAPSGFYYTFQVMDDPLYTARFMNQFSEMIERDRNHPSIAIWSLANESDWGSNFEKEYVHAKAVDPSRPVLLTNSGSVPKNVDGFDIYAKHYPKYDDDLGAAKRPLHKDVPKMWDEYIPPICLMDDVLKNDPNVRNFWGHSIKRAWENCFLTTGCLGGAICNALDDIVMLPEGEAGNTEFGIFDGWRRPKPEYWLTKKAYSPIRIDEGPLTNPGPGRPLPIHIKNWFDHTDLSEVTAQWSVGSESGTVTNLKVAPHANGVLTVPPRNWKNGDVLNLKFYRAGNIQVDEYNLPIGNGVEVFPAVQGPPPKITDEPEQIVVSGQNFSLAFAKTTGLITRGTYQGKTMIESGPYLNLGIDKYPDVPFVWTLVSMSHSSTETEAVINLKGFYHQSLLSTDHKPAVGVDFEIRIDGNGLMTTTYKLTHNISSYVERTGKLGEIGVSYVLPGDVDRLTWGRKALWSVYPSDHIGRPAGTAFKSGPGEGAQYRIEPRWPWSSDIKSFFYYGPQGGPSLGTQDFKSMKENIWFASCILAGSDVRLRAESDGTAAVRAGIRKDGKVFMNINNLWDYPEIGWGLYMTPFSVSVGYTNTVRVRLTDNDNHQVVFQDDLAVEGK